jgi:hypothetical protein
MMVFRISNARFARDLSGRGAQITGGRWNSKGVPMVYTSQSRALCPLKLRTYPARHIPDDLYAGFSVIPDQLGIMELQEKELPHGCSCFPILTHSGNRRQIYHRKQISCYEGTFSSCSGEYNFLLNPAASEFNGLQSIPSSLSALMKVIQKR